MRARIILRTRIVLLARFVLCARRVLRACVPPLKSARGVFALLLTQTHGTSADTSLQRVALQCLLTRLSEHVPLFNGGQPIGVGGGEVVASSLAVALDEGSGSEVSQTRARADQRLSPSFRPCVRVHDETVADPQFLPSSRTRGNGHGLTVDCYHSGGRFAHGTSGDVSGHLVGRDGHHHHRHGLLGGQPVAVVAAARVVAHLVQVAEHERHRGELEQATARCA